MRFCDFSASSTPDEAITHTGVEGWKGLLHNSPNAFKPAKSRGALSNRPHQGEAPNPPSLSEMPIMWHNFRDLQKGSFMKHQWLTQECHTHKEWPVVWMLLCVSALPLTALWRASRTRQKPKQNIYRQTAASQQAASGHSIPYAPLQQKINNFQSHAAFTLQEIRWNQRTGGHQRTFFTPAPS